MCVQNAGTIRPKDAATLLRRYGMQVIAAVLLAAVCVMPAAADTVMVNDLDQLKSNISGASGDRTIIIGDDIEISASDGIPVIGSGKNITLKPAADQDHQIKRTGANISYSAGMFTVKDGGNFTLEGNGTGNLTLNGAYKTGNTQSLVWVRDGGNFTLASGILANNTALQGSAVFVEDASSVFRMSGGVIENCTAIWGGGVLGWNFATLTLTDGIIQNCTATSSSTSPALGGAVYLNKTTMSMSGGVIKNCKAETTGTGLAHGGGVITVGDTATFKMSGWAEVTGNQAATAGSEVYHAGGAFTISGNAQVGPNDVYLADGKFITVDSDLTTTITNISLQTLGADTLVVKLFSGAGQEYLQKFSLSPSVSRELRFVGEINPPELRLAGAVPPPPPPPVSTGSSDGNMDNALRVLFDTQGGSFVQPATSLSYGDRIPEPAVPEKSGATFGGWYTDAACTHAWNFGEDGIPGDITLYAKWTSGSTAAAAIPTPSVTPTASVSATQTTVPQTVVTTWAATTAAAAGVQPTLTQAPAPAAGLLAAGVFLRRRK